MNAKYITLLFFFGLLISCNKTSNELQAVKVFDNSLAGNKVSVLLEDLCSSVEIVTITDLPGNVNFLYETQDNYFIIFKGGIVNKYDKQGNFLHKIGTKGRGPGEYLMPVCLSVLPDSSLYILDARTQKLLKYNLNGEYISGKELTGPNSATTSFANNPATMFVESEGKLYFFTNGNYTNIEYGEYDPQADKYKRLVAPNREMGREFMYGNTLAFGAGNKQFIFNSSFNDTLFKFDNNKFEPELLLQADGLKWDFNELNVKNYSSVTAPRISYKWMNSSDTYIFISYSITEGARRSENRNEYLGIYNFKTQKYIQNVEITSKDPATIIDPESRLYTGVNSNELLKIHYPDNENCIEIIKYQVK